MKKIDKDRIWVFSPTNNVVIKACLDGSIDTERLKDSIQTAGYHHEMLNQKIVFDKRSHGFYEKVNTAFLFIKEDDRDWMDIVKEQEKIAFQIDKGEFIRFYIIKHENETTLLMIAHHVAADGMSLIYLLQDILHTLDGQAIEYKGLNLLHGKNLPKESKLSISQVLLILILNKGWRRSGARFILKDLYRIHKTYWNTHESYIETYTLEHEHYNRICSYSKEHDITINTLITTAFSRALGGRADVGHAVNIRKKDNTSLGNYASGISTIYEYNEELSFLENAKKIQALVYEKLHSPRKKYLILQFMSKLEASLIDSVYFTEIDKYENKISTSFANMFGYSGNPKDISITNLTNLPIDVQYKSCKLMDVTFIPPFVLNSNRVLGIASLNNKMVLSLHVNRDEHVEFNQNFFNKGVEYLKKI